MHVVESISGEFRRYRDLAERAIRQLTDADVSREPPGGGNSIATIGWHLAGNFRSRFTDLLTTDGEKAWRRRDEEFVPRSVTRTELLAHVDEGWVVLFDALSGLTDDDLNATITIRGQALTVCEALHRSVAHASYHVGQIVHIARTVRGPSWVSLSIPPGESASYSRNPTRERAPAVCPDASGGRRTS